MVDSVFHHECIEFSTGECRTNGLPIMIVFDNGPCFTSVEFSNFVSSNGIIHK